MSVSNIVTHYKSASVQQVCNELHPQHVALSLGFIPFHSPDSLIDFL